MFQIRKLSEDDYVHDQYPYVLTVTLEEDVSPFPGEPAVEHFQMSQDELAELFGVAEAAYGGPNVKDTVKKLTDELNLRETQVADLRRELQRERESRGIPAGTPIYLYPGGKFGVKVAPESVGTLEKERDEARRDARQNLETAFRLERELAEVRRREDEARKEVRRLEEEVRREKMRTTFARSDFGPSPVAGTVNVIQERDWLRAELRHVQGILEQADRYNRESRENRANLARILQDVRNAAGIDVGDDLVQAVLSLRTAVENSRSGETLDDLVRETEGDDDDIEDDPLTSVVRMHRMLDATGANFPPGCGIEEKVKAVCDELIEMRRKWAGKDPVVQAEIVDEWCELIRFRDGVGQMVGADNPRSIPSVFAALSRIVTEPALAAARNIPVGHFWRFRRIDGPSVIAGAEYRRVLSPTLAEARNLVSNDIGKWRHDPEDEAEKKRAYMETCDYPPKTVDPS
jgi:hypothetical protein